MSDLSNNDTSAFKRLQDAATELFDTVINLGLDSVPDEELQDHIIQAMSWSSCLASSIHMRLGIGSDFSDKLRVEATLRTLKLKCDECSALLTKHSRDVYEQDREVAHSIRRAIGVLTELSAQIAGRKSLTALSMDTESMK